MRAAPLCLALATLLALAACKPAPAPATPAAAGADLQQAATVFPQQLQALGNEPFWSVHADGGQLHWSSTDNIEGIGVDAVRAQTADGLRYSGQMEGMDVALVITAQPCSDGMSDTVYPWTAQWTQGDKVFKGCARPPLAP